MTDSGKFTILIVDDERSNISVLSHILRPMYIVLAAKNGPDAISIAKKSSPDLILLDIVMPEMSGFEVLKELKNSDLTRDIPVIIITGLDNRESEEKGLLLGAVDYIAKPFHDSVVRLRVKTHLTILSQMRTIERMCMIDALTEIPNRRGFDNQLNAEWNRAIREKTTLGLLMIDIDKFKIFNDSYGHAHGDLVLKTAAEIISKTVKRPSDFAARWGGEEFSVLLPNTGLNGALEVAEQIRVNIENAVIQCSDGRNTQITVSIGVNSEFPDIGKEIDDFVSIADQALYLAKDDGRNLVRSLPGV